MMRPSQAQKSLPHIQHVRLGSVEVEVLVDLALYASLLLSVAGISALIHPLLTH